VNNLKKVISIVSLCFIFFIIYFLQANFFSWFNIAGIKPNLIILLMLVIGLFIGKKVGIIFAIITGILLDLLGGKIIGITSIMFIIIVILSDIYDKNFSKDSKIAIMLMVISTTTIYEVGVYMLNIIKTSSNIEFFAFTKILVVEIIFNAILTIILYPIIQKAGMYLENNFKEPKILTRYF
jgi:rod shape-determining protein MreD